MTLTGDKNFLTGETKQTEVRLMTTFAPQKSMPNRRIGQDWKKNLAQKTISVSVPS